MTAAAIVIALAMLLLWVFGRMLEANDPSRAVAVAGIRG